MRRAFQRCSASLTRPLSTLTPTSRIASQSLRTSDVVSRTTFITFPATRSIHQTPRLRDAATEQPTPSETITTFAQLESRGIVHRNVVRTLTQDMSLETMTEVQQRTINEALKGQDVIAQAKTGTGKTLAFLLPILQRIINEDPSIAERGRGRRGPRTTADDIRGLIISPTRELAEQIAMEAKKLCRNTGVIVQTAVGGTQKSAGLRAIQREGCHLLVGTPGRLKDILSDQYSKVEAPDLQALVFDEADRLLDQGFWPEVQEIMRMLPTTAEKDRQTLMFSATVPKEVVSIVRSTLKPGFNFVKCVRDDEEPTHKRVPQKSVSLVGLENCIPSLIELSQRSIEASQEPGARPFKAIVFFNSTAEVSLATSALLALQTPSDQQADNPRLGGGHPWYPTKILEIHARLTQAQRTRAANDFRRATSGILLSSDVTARGMDFPDVTHVIQVGLPPNREQYIHRLGRTARAGKEGEGWIFLNEVDQNEARGRLRDINLIKDDTLQIPKMDLTRPADVPAYAGKILSMYQAAIKSVPMAEKAKVYLAQFGTYQWFPRKQQLVQMMNNLSRFGWGLATPPSVPAGLASKLRISRIEGVVIGNESRQSDDRRGAFGGGSGRGGFAPREGGRDSGFDSRGGDRGGYGGDRGDRGGYRSDRGGYGGDRAPRNDYGGDRGGRSSYGGDRGGFRREGGGRDRPQRNDAFESY
ncbi:Putative ATP-dependent RNA helicase DEAD-box, Helicase superfamily 1/2, ATP-binding protein [Septoria linicola]|uniref:ATP-dependent RNA helicase n=1 Tax=Septoria linicola TaxID=215465 RepID=A0A9Q9AWQ9_9PEZI|nr:putative ATP-dependent RNA helicase DEAD-box, Helicase superfamily 1/2, ATP-binding protein [Septoria linicola]USW53226.1 Putative ATP-dependent RNA helicase DEAD-box, Helicase superfamily 1/2, ATP-binding protein [Septoria linicola]